MATGARNEVHLRDNEVIDCRLSIRLKIQGLLLQRVTLPCSKHTRTASRKRNELTHNLTLRCPLIIIEKTSTPKKENSPFTLYLKP